MSQITAKPYGRRDQQCEKWHAIFVDGVRFQVDGQDVSVKGCDAEEAIGRSERSLGKAGITRSAS